MTNLGIFAKIFVRPTFAEALDAVTANKLFSIQLNMQSAGLDSMPSEISVETAARVRSACEGRGISIASLSGTFNMIHPDRAIVNDGIERLKILVTAAPKMGACLISLCTGTRDPENMWRRHATNDSNEAWADLKESMARALEIAERGGVVLGIEPEPGNVINSAAKCKQLLEHFDSPFLKVVFDPANLVSTNLTRDPLSVLEEAFELLGSEIAIGHGKDCGPNGEIVPAGKGIVPWEFVLRGLGMLEQSGSIPLIIHGIEELEVADVVRFLRNIGDRAS